MCTAMTLQTPQQIMYFGRTMDFSYPLDPELYVVPKNYEWSNIQNSHHIRNQYRFMGTGQNLSPIIFTDGVNEAGFTAAALYFPGYAQYDSIRSQNSASPPIAAMELTGFLLGLCASVEQAASLLNTIQIIGAKDPITNSIAPLHWIIADTKGRCMTVEKTADGLHLMDNPIGVLSNSPDFQWHLTNLRNYMNLSPFQISDEKWGTVHLTPFGQGSGALGLPGDYTPPSRFVRTAYQKTHIFPPTSQEESINTCFHLMESVSIPKGIVITGRGATDYTQYTIFFELSTKRCFFKTYDNSQIFRADLPAFDEYPSEIRSLGKLTKPAHFQQLFHPAPNHLQNPLLP